ncbi:MAG: hypothetical protein HYW07_15080 [Candidatus Latescibacteria bacterium]|nr:hypothetical protein [Candidatus Latescibacterota bacterium]
MHPGRPHDPPGTGFPLRPGGRGGTLCHAAIIARERGIPCVVGTGEATRRIRPRMLVEVDGTAGVVKKLR